jgi:CRISPR/Cas system-associated exonuclease Cas4 (RecB family)
MSQAFDPVLGARVQPAPGVITISPWRLRDETRCRRRAYFAHVLGLRVGTPDEHEQIQFDRGEDLALIGLEAHAELRARHDDHGRHDDESTIREDAVGDANIRRAVDRAVAAHNSLCPARDGATYLGGEIDLMWFVHRKLVLVSGRIDALWLTADGVYQVHEYKTGRGAADSIADDPAPGVYGLLVRAKYPDADVRIVYELLGGETPRTFEVEVTPEHRRSSWNTILGLVDSIRQHRDVSPTPDARCCRSCPYLRSCPEGREVAQ